MRFLPFSLKMGQVVTAANSWLYYALASAVFAALTAIFGKIGVSDIHPNLATLIRTVLILLLVAGMVTANGQWQMPSQLSQKGLVALLISGLMTGLSWLCYYRALALAPASRVAPIDKLSLVFVLIFSAIFLGETLDWKTALGGGLMVAGAVMVAF